MLEKILKELQLQTKLIESTLKYQTKLMETIYEKKDEHRVGAAMIKKQIESVQKVILNTPGINPEMAKMINSIFNTMPGGGTSEH